MNDTPSKIITNTNLKSESVEVCLKTDFKGIGRVRSCFRKFYQSEFGFKRAIDYPFSSHTSRDGQFQDIPLLKKRKVQNFTFNCFKMKN